MTVVALGDLYVDAASMVSWIHDISLNECWEVEFDNNMFDEEQYSYLQFNDIA